MSVNLDRVLASDVTIVFDREAHVIDIPVLLHVEVGVREAGVGVTIPKGVGHD